MRQSKKMVKVFEVRLDRDLLPCVNIRHANIYDARARDTLVELCFGEDAKFIEVLQRHGYNDVQIESIYEGMRAIHSTLSAYVRLPRPITIEVPYMVG